MQPFKPESTDLEVVVDDVVHITELAFAWSNQTVH
jgi:hypothetical protein